MKNRIVVNITGALLGWMCCMVAIIALCVKGLFTGTELEAEAAGVWHKTIASVTTAVNELQGSFDSLAEKLLSICDIIFNFIFFDYCDFILNLF